MDWGECGLGRCAIVGRIPYWGCKSNLCGADLEGGGASNLTGADRGRMWIGAVSPASESTPAEKCCGNRGGGGRPAFRISVNKLYTRRSQTVANI